MKKYFSKFELNRIIIDTEGCYYKQKHHETLMIIGGFIIIRILLLNIIFKIDIHKNDKLSERSKK